VSSTTDDTTGEDAVVSTHARQTEPAHRRRDTTARTAVAAAVLLVLGAGLMLQAIPDAEDTDRRIAEYLADDTAHRLAVLGYFTWVVALGAFLWFATRLRHVLRSAEPESSHLSEVGYAAALVFVVMALVAGAAFAAVPGAVQLGGADPPAADFVRVVPQFGFGLLRVAGGLANALFMITTSLAIKRTGVLPGWTVRAGYVAAAFAMLIITPVPLIAIPVWWILMGVAVGRR
jgi:hypothetical protein